MQFPRSITCSFGPKRHFRGDTHETATGKFWADFGLVFDPAGLLVFLNECAHELMPHPTVPKSDRDSAGRWFSMQTGSLPNGTGGSH